MMVSTIHDIVGNFCQVIRPYILAYHLGVLLNILLSLLEDGLGGVSEEESSCISLLTKIRYYTG